ncbi:subtilisin-like protease SBT3.6 [Momordica charantia]|uniref:Subtilisin-like protease SBT3.6 n=1 Tax=Momordica charantia TaxID=3673 RepID=A0A6J1C864_MOMCH|nr:subtilisin-like protease SBT3.6 [Momordica charantia]
MAAPHISGIVALLKSMHPTWSPAAIKSALITTAQEKDPLGAPILAEGSPPKLPDPFNYGGELVNPNAVADPGLIYDLAIADCVKYYLCGMGYKTSHISQLMKQKIGCPLQRPSVSDLNLPTITVPALRNSTTVTRTVTNVGKSSSMYRAVIRAPPGTRVSVEPRVLVFNSRVKKISFKVTISAVLHMNYGYSFGNLIGSDGVHPVKTPLSSN